MNRRQSIVWISLALLIAAMPFILLPGADFTGTDDLAKAASLGNRPDYEPWWTSWFEPSDEMETPLFALQASLGGVFMLFFVRVCRRRKMELARAKGRDPVEKECCT